MSPIILDPIPTFISSNNRRIDLTPGIVVVPFHRYRHLPSFSNSYNRFFKPIDRKIKSKSVRNDRQSIVHNVKTKISREIQFGIKVIRSAIFKIKPSNAS
jgi:hypothetical protein